MKLEKTIERLSLGTEGGMYIAARDLGHELPEQDFEKLRDFRASAARIKPRNEYHEGFIDALLAIAAAYEAATIKE